MADETTLETSPATEMPAPAADGKKTRKPRAPNAVAEAATGDVSVAAEMPAKKTRAKRGSNIAEAKADKSARAFKKVTASASPSKAPAPAPAAAVEVIDDIADLIKLEEENKQLRKQLSEKLRAENADLRKRLGQD